MNKIKVRRKWGKEGKKARSTTCQASFLVHPCAEYTFHLVSVYDFFKNSQKKSNAWGNFKD